MLQFFFMLKRVSFREETDLPQLPFFPFWCYRCEKKFEVEEVSYDVAKKSRPKCPTCTGNFVELMEESVPVSSSSVKELQSSLDNLEDFVLVENDNNDENSTEGRNIRRRSSIMEMINNSSSTTSQAMNHFFHDTLGIRAHPNDFTLTRSVGDFLDGLTELFPSGKLKGAPPIEDEVLKDLPIFEINPDENFTCPICLNEAWESDKQVMQLPCNHAYHSNCISKWLKKHCICPICRYELQSENETQF